MLSFEGGPRFHLPMRCEMVTRSGDLCDSCVAKETKTIKKMKEVRGTTIGGPHPSYLMGRVTDPIPYWCRLYDSAWFRLKIEGGARVSEENMVKIRKAVAKAYDGVAPVEPQPMPEGSRKVAAPKPVPEPAAEPKPQPVPEPAPVKKRIAVKKPVKNPELPAPVARVGNNPVDLSDRTIVRIKVRKQEVDGRMFYLDPKKDKLYDLKFKYMGRLKDGAIVSHPDSDTEP